MNNPNHSKVTYPRRLNSLRHPDADYSELGAYFITLCTHNRENLFGKIYNEQMQCNNLGMIVWQIWENLPVQYPNITIDSAILMPDHFHGIIEISGEVREPPLQPHNQPRRIMTIPMVVGYLKMNTAKQINVIRETPGASVWQRNYYDRIIESDEEFGAISEYILTNPSRWGLDKD
jgi:putative transposase